MSASAEVAELEAENRALLKVLNCSVCGSGRKDTIITKCFHVFCGACIRKNLETRHRKCPGCGTGFGQGDVRSIYIA